jgi:hypothetical protein
MSGMRGSGKSFAEKRANKCLIIWKKEKKAVILHRFSA